MDSKNYYKLFGNINSNGKYNIKTTAFDYRFYFFGQKNNINFKIIKKIIYLINKKRNLKNILILGYIPIISYLIKSYFKNEVKIEIFEEDKEFIDFLENLVVIDGNNKDNIKINKKYITLLEYYFKKTKSLVKINNFNNLVNSKKNYDLIIFNFRKNYDLYYMSKPFLMKLLNKTNNIIIITNSFEKKEFNKEFIIKRLKEVFKKSKIKAHIEEEDNLLIINKY